jgi:hypothetical protein
MKMIVEYRATVKKPDSFIVERQLPRGVTEIILKRAMYELESLDGEGKVKVLDRIYLK